MFFARVMGLTLLSVFGLAEAQAAVTQAQQVRGADLFYRRCSVCHGTTGLGLTEARLAFPESHRRCTQCHKSGSTPLLTYPLTDNQMFDVGEAPALRGPGTLPALTDAASLRAYIRATMPRHAPGSLSGLEAADLAAFVLELRANPPKAARDKQALPELLPN